MSVTKLPASAGYGPILEAFQKDGAVIIQGLLSSDLVKRFDADITPELARINSGKPAEMMDYNDVADAYGSNTKRLMDTPNFSKVFRDEVLELDLVHELCERIFASQFKNAGNGGYWLNTCSVIEIGPGNGAQPLHRDQESWDAWTALGPSAPEACVNFFMALTPSTDANGATRVVPGSHLWPNFETSIDANSKFELLETVPAELGPGDCMLFSGKLLHGGGANKTTDQLRRCVATSFIRAGLMPEHAYPMLVPLSVAETMTYRGQAMLGFRSRWPAVDGKASYFWTKDYEELGEHLGLKDKPIFPEGRTATA